MIGKGFGNVFEALFEALFGFLVFLKLVFGNYWICFGFFVLFLV